LAINSARIDAVVEVLNALVMQLIDMNTSMSELYSRQIVNGTYLQGVVDELRTLNSALSRLEDTAIYRP
jgi:hypothetical protein